MRFLNHSQAGTETSHLKVKGSSLWIRSLKIATKNLLLSNFSLVKIPRPGATGGGQLETERLEFLFQTYSFQGKSPIFQKIFATLEFFVSHFQDPLQPK